MTTIDVGFSWDSPAGALALIARHFGVIAADHQIRRHLDAHSAPHSLLALVKVAGALGLQARARRVDLAALAQMPLPAILHVRNPLYETDQGFVVVSDRDEQGLVFSREGGGQFRLGYDEVALLWTGIAVNFGAPASDAGEAPDAPGTRGPARWLSTMAAATVEGLSRRIVLVGLPLAAASGALGLTRSAAGAADGRLQAIGLLVWVTLAGCGLLVSRELLLRAHPSSAPGAPRRLVDRLCGGGGAFDCDGVLSSRWASLFGSDLGALGLAFFAAALAVLGVAAALPIEAQRSAYRLLALVHLAAVPLSVLLIAVQVYPLRRFCILCLGAHLAVLVGGAAGMWVAFGSGPSRELAARELLPFLVLHGFAFLLALGVLVPSLTLARRLDESLRRLGWIESTSQGALAVLLGRPRAVPAPPASPFVLGSAGAALRIDALVDPQCSACGTVVDQLEKLVERHQDDVHVMLHFPTRDPRDNADRELRVALTAAGSVSAYHACRDRSDQLHAIAAQGAAAVLAHLQIAGTPLATARSAQGEADVLADAFERLTPMLFVGGKPWLRRAWELDLMLSCHSDRLAPLRSGSLDAQASAAC